MRRERKFGKTIVTMAMAMMLSVTAVIGFGTSAKAANVSDEQYWFSNGNVTGTTRWREKQNNTKVYVYPISGPKIRYKVYGFNNNKEYAASGTHEISTGIKASITNRVWEDREDTNHNADARVYMQRINYQPVDTTGYWSPDSTKNYTIFG